jgi:hypothetical protein
MENRGRHEEIDEDVQRWRLRLQEKRKEFGGKRGKDRGRGER